MASVRVCSGCAKEKPTDEFYPTKKYQCKQCQCAYEKRKRALIAAGQWRPNRERTKTPKATRSPTVRDLMWAAGFLEGEAAFYAGNGGTNISVAQVYPEPLYRLQEVFGGTVKPRPLKYKDTIRQQMYWTASGARGRGIMLTLYPFLSSRRKEQIGNVLRAVRTNGL